MNLTREQAKQIRDTFGPCSVLYECREVDEIIEEAKHHKNMKAVVEDFFESESIYLEQRGNQWSGENEAQFKAEVAGDQAFLKAMAARIKALLA